MSQFSNQAKRITRYRAGLIRSNKGKVEMAEFKEEEISDEEFSEEDNSEEEKIEE